ncbi:MAG TPA: S9 family peptidase [Anaerolineae bacterium]
MIEQSSPPIAPERPYELTLHDHTRVDNYYWLRQRDNPDVVAYLEAENAYTKAVMAHTEALQEALYREMVGRIQETDTSAPVRDKDYYYYSRTEADQQYNIYCRKHMSLEAEEEVLLDLNAIAAAAGYDYLKLGVFKPSPDHRRLAYSLDSNGSERFTLYVKDLATGGLLPDEIPNTFYSVEWANDNRTLFYTTQDEAWRSDKLFRHTLGATPGGDPLLYHETDELFSVWLSKTKDQAYLLLTVRSLETGEVHYLSADAPSAGLTVIRPRQKGLRYSVGHHGGAFYIRTNDDAPNFKVVTAPVVSPAKENWQELIPHRDDTLVESIALFVDHLVLHNRHNGLETIEIRDLQSGATHRVDFPEPTYALVENWPPDIESNPEFNTNRLRFTYSSLATADSTFDYNMDTRTRELVKQKPVLGGYDPDDYRSDRIFATAGDGARIPISIVYKKGVVERPAPCLLYGYGSYGASMNAAFDIKRLSLLDRGLIYAIAHIRGGQEMGRAWYDQGKFLNKKNTFTDFIACARHLIDEGYTSSDRLAIMGRSAGGLLMGAVVTMAPELFKAAVAGVPFVDVVTTMLDASIPLTIAEYEEWGNPNEKEYYDYMLSYSPYDNTQAREYPNLLITAGLNDPRVQYWEPAKWAAKLRALKTDDNRLLLKTHMGAGHFSSSGRYDYLKDVAFEYAFILDVLGVE